MEQRRTQKRNKKKRFFSTLLAFISVIALIGVGIFIAAHLMSPKDKELKKKPKVEKTTKEIKTKPSSHANKTIESTEEISPTAGVQVVLNDTELKASAEKVYYDVYYFNSGDYCSSNNSIKTSAASIIKVFIMEYAYAEEAAKKISLDEIVNGISIAELIKKMIQSSDNEATNALIAYFGMDKLNVYFSEQGYKDTVLERNMLDNDARSRGLDNYTSLDDAMAFLKKLYDNRTTRPSSAMIEVMKNQTIRTKIPSLLPPELSIANKTGELEGVENDMGIVFVEEAPFAIVVLTDEGHDIAGVRKAIGNFALEAYQKAVKE